MRWAIGGWFGRRRTGSSDGTPAVAQRAPSQAGQASPPAGQGAAGPPAPRRAARPAWRVLPPLRPTASPEAPVLIPPRLPDVSTTRPILRVPPPPARDDRPIGVVSGIGSVLPPVSQPAVEAPPVPLTPRRRQPSRAAADAVEAVPAEPPAAGPLPELAPAPRAVLPRATPARPLLSAVDEYVGEPQVPATPHRAPAWLRAAQEMLTPADDFLGLPAPTAQQPSFLRPASPPKITKPSAPGRRVPTRRHPGAPRQIGLGAPLPEPPQEPEPAPQPRPEPQIRTEPVPPDLVTAFRSAHGTDVSDVPVHRGRQASDRAQAIEAGAFTSGGEVFLPAEAGPLTEPAARGILAHELAHVVQQRQLGSSLPDEHSPHGRQLEAQARAHEDWARTGAIGAPPVLAAPPQQHAPSTPMIHPKVQRIPRTADTTTTTPPPTSTSTSTTTSSTSTSTSTSTDTSTSSGSSAGTSSSAGGSGSDTGELVGGVRLPDNSSWTSQHDAANPRNASELGNMFAESFGGLVLDSWGIDGEALPDGGLERDTRRTQLRTQLLDEINAERTRLRMEPLRELPDEAYDMVEDQLDRERHAGMGSGGGGHGGGRGGFGHGGSGGSGGSGHGGSGYGGGAGGRRQDQDDGRIRNFREFGGELALGMVDLVGGGMFDLTADEEREIRGRPAQSGSAGAGGTSGLGSGGGAHGMTGASHAAGADGHADELIHPDRMDLDELAVRIYDRLRSRLRTELLVDRERAGLLSDFR